MLRSHSGRQSRAWIEAVLCLAGSVSLASCVSPSAVKPLAFAPPGIVRPEIRLRKEYVLVAGDQIDIVVRRFPEVSKTVTVRPDGAISLPLVDDVAAAGKTIPELGSALTERFSARLVKPEVTVIATQVRQPMVYVVGDVNSVVAVPLRNASTALEAIAYSGGLRRTGASRSISIVRLGEDGYLRTIPVSVTVRGQSGPYIALGQTPLQADDLIFVPENRRSQMTRFLDDFINKPLLEANLLLQPYVSFRFVQAVTP